MKARQCVFKGCKTILSSYNKQKYCFYHINKFIESTIEKEWKEKLREKKGLFKNESGQLKIVKVISLTIKETKENITISLLSRVLKYRFNGKGKVVVDEVSKHRLSDCKYYDDCLKFVSRKKEVSFSCCKCQKFLSLSVI